MKCLGKFASACLKLEWNSVTGVFFVVVFLVEKPDAHIHSPPPSYLSQSFKCMLHFCHLNKLYISHISIWHLALLIFIMIFFKWTNFNKIRADPLSTADDALKWCSSDQEHSNKQQTFPLIPPSSFSFLASSPRILWGGWSWDTRKGNEDAQIRNEKRPL